MAILARKNLTLQISVKSKILYKKKKATPNKLDKEICNNYNVRKRKRLMIKIKPHKYSSQTKILKICSQIIAKS